MENPVFDDLIGHLERTLGMEKAAAVRVVNEVLAYFDETVTQFVLRRHGELQAESQRNEEIFERLLGEVEQRRFAAAPMSPRQVRRLIYG